MKNVYLAGKITNNNWRDQLIERYMHSQENDGIVNRAWTGDVCDCFTMTESWTTVENCLKTPSGKMLNCTGPWWMPLAGSSGHGTIDQNPSPHKMGTTEPHHWSTADLDTAFTRDQIINAIQKADLLFCWIDCVSCYGTLAEIGFARGLNKKIAIGILPELHKTNEFWLTCSLANSVVVAQSAKEAWYKTMTGQDVNRTPTIMSEITYPEFRITNEDAFFAG